MFSHSGIFNVQLQWATLLDIAGVNYSVIAVYLMCSFNGPCSWILLGKIVYGSVAATWSYVVFRVIIMDSTAGIWGGICLPDTLSLSDSTKDNKQEKRRWQESSAQFQN